MLAVAVLSVGCAGKEPEPPCPQGMALVPRGAFAYGDRAVTGRKTHEEIAGFCIDLYEFPNRAGARPERDATWLEAAAKCRSLGKRLCTEYEWEKACRGPRGLVYPWGNTFDPSVCALDPADASAHASGARPGCVSFYGVFDMAGSVWEWTENAWEGDPSRRVVRGGWENSLGELGASCSYRGAQDASRGTPRIGWRCCMSSARASSASPVPVLGPGP